MDEFTIANRLYSTADFAARVRGYQFSQDTEADMRMKATGAAHNILMHPASHTNLVGLVKIGEMAFEYLVEEMARSSDLERSLDPAFPSILGGQTLSDSILRFCPMWPIC